MKYPLASAAVALAMASVSPAASGQSVRYEFTGGSMAPTVNGLPAGVTASNFSLGNFTFAALSDNGGNGNSLRLSRGDLGTSSATALAGPAISFTLTIPAGTTLNLTSLALDFTSGGVTGAEYINARVFSSIDGYDNLTSDTIGTLGRVANGADSGTMSVSLATPDSNSTNGANSNNGDFDGLTNRTVTFYLPFIRDGQTTATDYVDIDNITLGFVESPAPGGSITAFTATAVSPTEIALSWAEDFSNETGFVIERTITGANSWTVLATTAANATSFSDPTVVSGNDYTYRIKADLSGGGQSTPVNSASVSLISMVKFEFTGGDTAPTLALLPAGVTVSNIAIGSGLGNLFDNSAGPDAPRISGDDTQNTTAAALSNNAYLSFSITIPNGTYLRLLSLGLDHQATNAYARSSSQIFTSIDGFDAPDSDAIGLVGRTTSGSDTSVVNTILSLSNPSSNPGVGNNVTASDFSAVTNQTLTIYIPWIDESASNTRWTDIDNITLEFALGAPGVSNFTATSISSLETALAWDESLSDETGFVIERSVTGSGAWETVITTGPDVTSIRDLTMAPGSSYTYRFSATLTGGGTSPAVLSNPVMVPAQQPSAPLVVMPVGDSITEGAGGIGGYRSPLFISLTNAGMPIHYVGTRSNGTSPALVNAGETSHEGHGSYATTLITGNLDGLLNPVALPYGTPPNTNEGGYWLTGTGSRPAVYPDVILLMIGTNDLGMFQRTPAQVYTYYDLLLTKLVTLRPGALIICSSIPPYTGDDFVGTNPVKDYSQREANNQAFNQMLPGLIASYQSRGHRVRFSDVRQQITPENQTTLIGGDGVHPTGPGYNAIAAAWFDAMKQLPLIASWRILRFGNAAASEQTADLADPDGDGDSNLTEYALGTDPMTAGASPVTGTTVTESDAGYLSVTFPRRKHADLRYIVEVSPDLASWSADTIQAGSPASLDADFEQVTFRDRQPSAGSEKRFIRLKIVNP